VWRVADLALARRVLCPVRTGSCREVAMTRFARFEICDCDEVVMPIRPLRRVEVEALLQLGWFEDERLELLDGSLVTLEPSMNAHTIATARIAAMLGRQLGPAWTVLQHAYLALDEHSMPEPDVVVVSVSARSSPAPLVVEVSDVTFHNDSVVKAMLYGEAGIPTYWLVDLVRKQVRVHERPIEGRYTSIEECRLEAVLTAGELPAVALPVGEVLAAL
jgi:Uma2 family endonuclease